MTPVRDRAGIGRILDAIPPASGAVMMSTGIVSIDLSLDGRETLSRILLVIAGLAWSALALLLASRALGDPQRVRRAACTPAALAGVVGSAVLGARLTVLG
jgi:Voltage-dependent anion channel